MASLTPSPAGSRPDLRNWSRTLFRSGHEFARVASHIEGCTLCEEALRRLDQFADPLLSQLRQLNMTDGLPLEQVPHQLIAAVRSSSVRGGVAAWSAVEEGRRRSGRFELLERLGAGSFGYVYRARDTELGISGWPSARPKKPR
ncbi:MAG: hypothetical protein ACHRXM_13960 [Isosphaerales bacterium]